MSFRRTDFPAPEGPRMAVVFARGTSKVMSRSTVVDPKDLVTCRSEIIGLSIGVGTARSGMHTPGPDPVVFFCPQCFIATA
jgi:hypothetical protein